MRLLLTVLGIRLIFGTRLGCALFSVFGIMILFGLISTGQKTMTTFLLGLVVAFAMRRAIMGIPQ